MKRLGVFKELPSRAPDTLGPVSQWQRRGECARPGYDPETWFPIGDGPAAQQQTDEAKAACHRCPVMDTCLNWAMKTRQDAGVWGGLSEKERYTLRRRRNRSANPVPRVPVATFTTHRQAYDTLALAVDGHIEWTGGNEIKVDGKRRSPNQVAWRATRDRLPVGQVLIDCDHAGCVEHLTDQTIRDERAQQKRSAHRQAPVCGTPNGYKTHRRHGEAACEACQTAKTEHIRATREAQPPASITARDWSSSGHAPAGHKTRKVTPAQVDEIRALSLAGESLQDLALKYGVTAATIRGYAA